MASRVENMLEVESAWSRNERAGPYLGREGRSREAKLSLAAEEIK